jgi:hypothetical protein
MTVLTYEEWLKLAEAEVLSPANTRVELTEKLRDYESPGLSVDIAAIWPR